MERSEEKSRRRSYVTPKPFVSLKAERIVVDKIFETGSVRLLRATRRPGFAPDDFSAQTWGQQREDTLDQSTIEAFVGMKAPRALRVGDVFYVADGTKLSREYRGARIMALDLARQDHLLKDWEEPGSQPPPEIKKEIRRAADAGTGKIMEAGANPMPRARKNSA